MTKPTVIEEKVHFHKSKNVYCDTFVRITVHTSILYVHCFIYSTNSKKTQATEAPIYQEEFFSPEFYSGHFTLCCIHATKGVERKVSTMYFYKTAYRQYVHSGSDTHIHSLFFFLSSSGQASVSLTLQTESAEVDSPYWSLNTALLASQPVHPKVPV